MPGARFQPRSLARIRRDLIGRGVGAIFTNSRAEIFGSGALVSMFGNPTQVIAPKHGYARKFVAAGSQYARITPPPGIIDLTDDFAVVVAFVADSTANARIIHYSDTKNGQNLQVMLLTNRLSLVVGTGANEFAKVHSIANIDTSVPYVAVAGKNADGYYMYLDGALQNTGGTGGIANNFASTDIQIARRGDNASYFNGQIALFAHVKGSVDARSLSLNPWQLFEEEDDDIYVAPAAAPNSYLLTAQSGAFSLAGGAAALLANRAITAAPRAFALAGGATAVRAARRMAAAPSAFALDGAGAGLRAARRLPAGAGAGAFGLAGAAASLTAGRRLSAATGSFTVLGQTAALLHTAAPAPEGPTYVLTAAPGSFALAASPAALVVARRLVAGGGAFGITASPARIAVNRRLSAGPGQFDVARAAVLLQVARRIPAAPGTFMVVGADVALKYSSQIEYTRAPAGSGYTPRRHEYQSRPVQVSTDGRPSAIQENYR